MACLRNAVCVVALCLLSQLHVGSAATACFYLNDCNGHGDCNTATYTCSCYEGWGASTDIAVYRSPDCSLRTCPSDLAWVDIPASASVAHNVAECANQGICDRATGKCRCFPGFEGDACQRSSCPNSCSGHGMCISVRQMTSESNAMPAGPNTLVYGGFETSTTWDENKIYGCVCDSSWLVGIESAQSQLAEWFGPDCSLKHCPSGDDPMTTNIETDCAGKSSNGAVVKTYVNGGGDTGNLCHVDCANRGLCEYSSGLCRCFEGFYGEACTLQSALARDQTL